MITTQAYTLAKECFNDKIAFHEGYFHVALIPNSKGFIISTNNYNRNLLNKKFIYSLHAEVSVLHTYNNIIKNNNKKIKKLIVFRYNKCGFLRNSKPCKQCCLTMLIHNVKSVIYSEDNGTITKIKVKDLLETY
jgi:cytidine deaminase